MHSNSYQNNGKKGKVKLFVLTAQLILVELLKRRLKVIESEGIQRIYKVKLFVVQLPYNWYVSAIQCPCGYGRVSPSQAKIVCWVKICGAVVVVLINVFNSIEIYSGYFL